MHDFIPRRKPQQGERVLIGCKIREQPKDVLRVQLAAIESACDVDAALHVRREDGRIDRARLLACGCSVSIWWPIPPPHRRDCADLDLIRGIDKAIEEVLLHAIELIESEIGGAVRRARARISLVCTRRHRSLCTVHSLPIEQFVRWECVSDSQQESK